MNNGQDFTLQTMLQNNLLHRYGQECMLKILKCTKIETDMVQKAKQTSLQVPEQVVQLVVQLVRAIARVVWETVQEGLRTQGALRTVDLLGQETLVVDLEEAREMVMLEAQVTDQDSPALLAAWAAEDTEVNKFF